MQLQVCNFLQINYIWNKIFEISILLLYLRETIPHNNTIDLKYIWNRCFSAVGYRTNRLSLTQIVLSKQMVLCGNIELKTDKIYCAVARYWMYTTHWKKYITAIFCCLRIELWIMWAVVISVFFFTLKKPLYSIELVSSDLIRNCYYSWAYIK